MSTFHLCFPPCRKPRVSRESASCCQPECLHPVMAFYSLPLFSLVFPFHCWSLLSDQLALCQVWEMQDVYRNKQTTMRAPWKVLEGPETEATAVRAVKNDHNTRSSHRSSGNTPQWTDRKGGWRASLWLSRAGNTMTSQTAELSTSSPVVQNVYTGFRKPLQHPGVKNESSLALTHQNTPSRVCRVLSAWLLFLHWLLFTNIGEAWHQKEASAKIRPLTTDR